MSSKKTKSVHFKGGHAHHGHTKKHTKQTGASSSLPPPAAGSQGVRLPTTPEDGASNVVKPGTTENRLKPGTISSNFLTPDTAANVYDHVGAGRRRSSVMIEYYRDNYMQLKSGEVTDQHLQDIRDTFKLLDGDGDGRLSTAEITNLLRYIGSLKSDTEMEEMLAPIDVDHNGSIDFDEFKQFIIEKDILRSLADETNYEMQDAFNVFDKDGNGFIDKKELMAVLTKIGDKIPEELADEFIKEADLNGDGKIDYKEFCKHMGY